MFIISCTILILNLIPIQHKSDKQLVILGSGGHTREMLYICQQLNIQNPTFILADNDKYSKIIFGNVDQYKNCEYKTIIRARNVKQSYLSSTVSCFKAFIQSFKLLMEVNPQIIISNGPGTSLPLIVASKILTFLNMTNTKILFIESYCRIQNISLTGKLVRHIVDKYIVNFKEIEKYGTYLKIFPQ